MIPYSQIFTDIASGLVQHPSKLIVRQEQITSVFHRLAVECDPLDYSQIIGKQARHICSFQNLLGCVAAKRGEKVDVSVLSPIEKIQSEPNLIRPIKASIIEKICSLITMILQESIRDQFTINTFNRDLVTYLVILTPAVLNSDLLESIQSLLQAYAKVSGKTIRIENDSFYNSNTHLKP